MNLNGIAKFYLDGCLWFASMGLAWTIFGDYEIGIANVWALSFMCLAACGVFMFWQSRRS